MGLDNHPQHDLDTANGTFPHDEPEVSLRSRLLNTLFETLETFVLAVIMVLLINTVSARIRVDGISMEPSFYQDNYVIVNKLAYRFGEMERGDVVVFPYPNNPDEDYIKRVIGLPGDEVEIIGGIVIVNGAALEEPYISEPAKRDYYLIVPEGELFLMGDNRNDSSDSRAWGTLPVKDVIGKAVFIYWPFSDFGIVTHYQLDVPEQIGG